MVSSKYRKIYFVCSVYSHPSTSCLLFSISPASADLLTGSSGYLASEKTASYLHEKVHAVSSE